MFCGGTRGTFNAIGPQSRRGGQHQLPQAGVLAGTAEFYDRKVHRALITRTVSGAALKWLQFCAWIAQRCWNLDKFQRLVSEDKVQNVMATLLRGSKWKDLKWHAWRRLGPATMYKAGGKNPSIKAWFRWRSTRTAMAYINRPHPGRIRHPFTTPTPPSYLKGRPWIAGTATRRCTEFGAPQAYNILEGNGRERLWRFHVLWVILRRPLTSEDRWQEG